MLGFVPQTPLASSRETRPTQWLPNLRSLRFLPLTEPYWNINVMRSDAIAKVRYFAFIPIRGSSYVKSYLLETLPGEGFRRPNQRIF